MTVLISKTNHLLSSKESRGVLQMLDIYFRVLHNFLQDLKYEIYPH